MSVLVSPISSARCNGVFVHRDALQRVRDAVGQQVSAVFQLYERNTQTLDVAACVSRSAAFPSISDMLEWLQDSERHFRMQYPSKFKVTMKSKLTSVLF